MKNRLVNITVRIVAAALLISLCALPVVIAPRDARAAFGDCIAYDSFTRGDGAIGSTETSGPSSEACPQYAWTGGTWTISGNKVVDTPTLGGDVLTDGSLENWTSGTDLTSWTETLSGTSTVNQETSILHGGSNSVKLVTDSSNSSVRIQQTYNHTIGSWYQLMGWVYTESTSKYLQFHLNNNTINLNVNPGTTWKNYYSEYRATVASNYVGYKSSTASESVYGDDLTLKPFTLSTLFTTINTNSIAGTYSVELTIPTTGWHYAGLAICLNSQDNPTAGIIIYYNRSNIIVDKFTETGAWTNLITEAASYSADKVIKADVTVASGHVYLTAYYDNVQKGSQQDITDAAIINNTYHGLFSTTSTNSFDKFYISNNIPNTATPTNTATYTTTNTPTASDTPTNTPTDTATFTPTASDTPTNTPTHTATFTNTFTITYTPTFTDTPTETYTPTETNTSTASKTPTNTFTPTNTATLHYDATTTYEAAYAYYTGIAEENYPTVLILSVLCGVILLGLIIWAVFYFLRRRR